MDLKGCWNNAADCSHLVPSLMSRAEPSFTFLLRGSASAFLCFGIRGVGDGGSPSGDSEPWKWQSKEHIPCPGDAELLRSVEGDQHS